MWERLRSGSFPPLLVILVLAFLIGNSHLIGSWWILFFFGWLIYRMWGKAGTAEKAKPKRHSEERAIETRYALGDDGELVDVPEANAETPKRQYNTLT